MCLLRLPLFHSTFKPATVAECSPSAGGLQGAARLKTTHPGVLLRQAGSGSACAGLCACVCVISCLCCGMKPGREQETELLAEQRWECWAPTAPLDGQPRAPGKMLHCGSSTFRAWGPDPCSTGERASDSEALRLPCPRSHRPQNVHSRGKLKSRN